MDADAVWVSDRHSREAAPALGEAHRLNVIALLRSGGPGQRSQTLAGALELIGAGEAKLLCAERLDLVAGNLRELAALLQWLRQADAHLLALDLGLDTREGGGALAASLLCRLAGWEQRRPGAGGARGRPGLAERNPKLHELIGELHARGMGLHAIARELNSAGVPTPRGGRHWRASSVQSALGYRRPEPLLRGAPPSPPGSAGRPAGPRPAPPQRPRELRQAARPEGPPHPRGADRRARPKGRGGGGQRQR